MDALKIAVVALCALFAAACAPTTTTAADAPPAPAYAVPAPVIVTLHTETLRPCLTAPTDPPPPKAKGGETLSEKAAVIAEELLRWRRWGAKAAALLQTCR